MSYHLPKTMGSSTGVPLVPYDYVKTSYSGGRRHIFGTVIDFNLQLIGYGSVAIAIDGNVHNIAQLQEQGYALRPHPYMRMPMRHRDQFPELNFSEEEQNAMLINRWYYTPSYHCKIITPFFEPEDYDNDADRDLFI